MEGLLGLTSRVRIRNARMAWPCSPQKTNQLPAARTMSICSAIATESQSS
jgi:hypothetical protein